MVQKLLLIYVLLKYSIGQVSLDFYPAVNQVTPKIKDETKNQTGKSIGITTYTSTTLNKILGPIELSWYARRTANYNRAMDNFLTQLKVGIVNVDASLNFRQLMTKYNRNTEVYEVFTNDGYVLSLFRIPGNGTPIFLMHGLLGSADDFIIAGPESGLAYLLSEENYDVWLGNARGNKHSRRHIFMDPSEALFWDFSWHEIGVYDLPAMIDFVLEKTKRKELKYIGHSQGTTVFFVMTSQKPEYNSKVSMMIALAPLAFLSHAHSPVVSLLAPGTAILQTMSRGIRILEFQPDGILANVLKQMVCGSGTLAEIICRNAIFLLSGFDFAQLNVSNLPVIFSHLPAGASIKQLVHYGQNSLFNEFRQFDLGSEGNFQRYGRSTPPSYDLSNIVTPVWMFCGRSDWLSARQDVDLLRSKLKRVAEVYYVPFETFNHVDFILAKDVKPLVYKRLLNILRTY
ncbi:unnamed protein product [Arctia plantaginis]|uniref:AB hydrolase-1 domain-containing protein n=1 Tax=Arctia plantaginis TaxID=874455 RepID=A0A8S1BC25_ARCPL|nr:unnamed protein product [Arctia plantaginis]